MGGRRIVSNSPPVTGGVDGPARGTQCPAQPGVQMYTIVTEARDGCVLTTLAGTVAVEHRARILEELAARAVTTGSCRLLMDISAATLVPDDVDALRTFARRMAEDPAAALCRIAFVDRISRFDPFELLCRGKGLAVEHFEDAATAIEWLLGWPTD